MLLRTYHASIENNLTAHFLFVVDIKRCKWLMQLSIFTSSSVASNLQNYNAIFLQHDFDILLVPRKLRAAIKERREYDNRAPKTKDLEVCPWSRATQSSRVGQKAYSINNCLLVGRRRLGIRSIGIQKYFVLSSHYGLFSSSFQVTTLD